MAAWLPYEIHILVVTLVLLVWFYLNGIYKKFKKSNIPHLEPTIPFGNMMKSTLGLRHMIEDISEAYNKFKDHKYVGFFRLINSYVLLRDPDIIKQITVKDYDYFLNHDPFIDEEIDPLFGKSLLLLKDNKWRDMRSTLSPAFTGSKMKNMCSFMAECSQQVTNYIMKEIQTGDKISAPIELKDLCTRYASDVIATTAFGVTVDSLKDKENEFYIVGKTSSHFGGLQLFKFFGYQNIPKIMKFFNVTFRKEAVNNFYRNLVHGSIEHREKEKIYRPDMIHLLMEARKGTLKYDEQASEGTAGFATVEEDAVNIKAKKIKWEDDDLTAQVLLFFVAGFDTSSTLMSFALYELAVDPTIQKKLHDEIDQSIAEHGEELTYEIIQKLTYLDMVISETLRKWPPFVVIDRECNREYKLGPSKDGANNDYKVKPKDILWLPIYSIHHDPKYWPNPEKFDPERFSDENKRNIRPCTFIPFGSGPRNCIGSRFALMESKMIVYRILSQFSVKINAKTQLPFKLQTNNFNLNASRGFWVNFVKRK